MTVAIGARLAQAAVPKEGPRARAANAVVVAIVATAALLEAIGATTADRPR